MTGILSKLRKNLLTPLLIWGLLGFGSGLWIAVFYGSGHLPAFMVPAVVLLAGLSGGILFVVLHRVFMFIIGSFVAPNSVLPGIFISLIAGGLSGWFVSGLGFGIVPAYGAIFGLVAGFVSEVMNAVWRERQS